MRSYVASKHSRLVTFCGKSHALSNNLKHKCNQRLKQGIQPRRGSVKNSCGTFTRKTKSIYLYTYSVHFYRIIAGISLNISIFWPNVFATKQPAIKTSPILAHARNFFKKSAIACFCPRIDYGRRKKCIRLLWKGIWI